MPHYLKDYTGGLYPVHYTTFDGEEDIYTDRARYGHSRGFQLISIDSEGRRHLEGWVSYDDFMDMVYYLEHCENAVWNRPAYEGTGGYFTEIRDGKEVVQLAVGEELVLDLAPRRLKAVNSVLMARLMLEAIRRDKYHGQVWFSPETSEMYMVAERTKAKVVSTGYGDVCYYAPEQVKAFLDEERKLANHPDAIIVRDVTDTPAQLKLAKKGRSTSSSILLTILLLAITFSTTGMMGDSPWLGFAVVGIMAVLSGVSFFARAGSRPWYKDKDWPHKDHSRLYEDLARDYRLTKDSAAFCAAHYLDPLHLSLYPVREEAVCSGIWGESPKRIAKMRKDGLGAYNGGFLRLIEDENPGGFITNPVEELDHLAEIARSSVLSPNISILNTLAAVSYHQKRRWWDWKVKSGMVIPCLHMDETTVGIAEELKSRDKKAYGSKPSFAEIDKSKNTGMAQYCSYPYTFPELIDEGPVKQRVGDKIVTTRWYGVQTDKWTGMGIKVHDVHSAEDNLYLGTSVTIFTFEYIHAMSDKKHYSDIKILKERILTPKEAEALIAILSNITMLQLTREVVLGELDEKKILKKGYLIEFAERYERRERRDAERREPLRQSDRVFIGLPVSPGVGKGRCVVISDSDIPKITADFDGFLKKRGVGPNEEVIIAAATLKGANLLALFHEKGKGEKPPITRKRLKGIIVVNDGKTSHTAIHAVLAGIPCVSCADIEKKLANLDGALITVDGSSGEIIRHRPVSTILRSSLLLAIAFFAMGAMGDSPWLGLAIGGLAAVIIGAVNFAVQPTSPIGEGIGPLREALRTARTTARKKQAIEALGKIGGQGAFGILNEELEKLQKGSWNSELN
ncbi:MAG: hypothetical protein HQ575_06350, partial [Candidatus Omnitrophica bacterium]|nr:hypothetical protein [Candidatus Omnitrophota bacterium]